ncbi:MAG TPA: LacI family DNA-binding transcriptional regulator [Candidatus Didemnitutus sp.]|nr:LacI family DNA-binding transcriptional regulator [Candidatus Didemnitutus sp.]
MDSPPAVVTMRDIARLAGGVHQSTVSLALRNHPAISLATRRHIQRTAAAAGYHRDPLLDAFNERRLQSGQRKSHPVLAFVVDFGHRRKMDASPLHGHLWHGALRAAETLFHRLELFLVGPGALTPERLDSILFTRGIDGLIVASFRPQTPPLELTWKRYCGVKIECQDWVVPHFTIATDLLQSTRVAYRRAKQLGYSRVGLLLEPGERARSDLAQAGYLVEHSPTRARGKPLIAPGNLSVQRLRKWIRSEQIDVVLAASAATGSVLTAAGFAPGREIGWACLALTEAERTVAGLVADYERAGALAVEQVVSLSRLNLRGPSSSSMITYVPSTWRDGPSLPSRHLLTTSR